MATDQEFQSFLDQVMERNDIVEIISEYTKLKRIGTRYSALCPLHNDKKSPSLSISADRQLFYCFGCGAGGTVINFIEKAENLDFMDAVKLLADRAHIPMPEKGSPEDKKRREETIDKKQRIYQINAEAGRYFYKNLAGEGGKVAYNYLREREIENSTIKSFGLGYAPPGWDGIIKHLTSLGFKEYELFEAGLVRQRDNGTYYDTFYDGRVMFPIINVQGNIIGFGGRMLNENSTGGKYINTPETLVFKKKENLFGLNFAKNDKSGRLLLMEGYMDVISLHQAGIGNAVASLGTAFTPEQARLLKRYAGKAVLCYDADQAGRKAAVRAGAILYEEDIKTKVLHITDGKDPDEFIKAKGPDMFRVLIEGAKPLTAYRIDEIKKEYNLKDPEQLLEFSEKAVEIIADLKNPVEQDIYIKNIAKDADMNPDSIRTQVDVFLRKKRNLETRRQEQKERRDFEARTGGRRDLHKMGVINAERLLLNLMPDSSVFKRVKEAGILPDDFSEGLHRRLAEHIFRLAEDGPVDLTALIRCFESADTGAVADILLDDKNIENKLQACNQVLETILQEKARNQEKNLLENGDLEELDRLLKSKKTNTDKK